MRFAKTAATLAVLLSTLAACGGDPPDDPQSAQPSSQSTAPPESPTGPAWEAKYNENELQAYRGALETFEAYETDSAPLWSNPKLTREAEAVFKKYFYLWQVEYARLKTYAENEITSTGKPAVLNSKPTRIKYSRGASSVTILQCIDTTDVRVFQHGEEADRAPGAVDKHPRRITLSEVARSEWKISAVKSDGKEPCVV